MANPNGNPGNKGGGRLSKRDEGLRELATQKAIGKYVKAVTNLGGMGEKEYKRIKEMCLPIVAKDMANKVANADGSKIEQILVKIIDESN